jgi:hypothetical protein
MLKVKRLLIIGAAVAAAAMTAVVAVPGSANAFPGPTQIKNYASGPNYLCMGVAGGDSKVADGANIITWSCDGTANQTWVIVPDSSTPNTYLIENSVATSECLSVARKSMSVGAQVVLWHCKAESDNEDQRWSFPSDRQAPYVYLNNWNSNLYAAAWFVGNGASIYQEQQIPAWWPRDAWLIS